MHRTAIVRARGQDAFRSGLTIRQCRLKRARIPQLSDLLRAQSLEFSLVTRKQNVGAEKAGADRGGFPSLRAGLIHRISHREMQDRQIPGDQERRARIAFQGGQHRLVPFENDVLLIGATKRSCEDERYERP